MVQANRSLPLVPAFAVKLNAKPVTKDLAPWIASISIHEEVNLPGMFELQLLARGPGDIATPWVDDARLKLGAQIELSLGYGEQLDTLIFGEITDLEPVFKMSSPPRLLVRGHDRRYRLNGAPHTNSFENLKASAIVEKIAAPVMPIKAEDSRVELPIQWQHNETHLAFLQRLAADIGYELVMNGATLEFRPRAHDQPAQVMLTFADDLFEFLPRMTLLSVANVTMVSWDPEKKQRNVAVVDRANPDNAGFKMGATLGTEHADAILGDTASQLVPVAEMTQAELDQLATALLDTRGLDYVRARGSCRGRTDVRAGRVISIENIGPRFSGPYYVTSAEHSYTPAKGYVTGFEVRRNAA